MKIKGVKFSEVKKKALANPAVYAAWEEEGRQEELRALLASMRKKAGLTQRQVAERMGISQPDVTLLECNIMDATVATLERYAAACGTHLEFSFR